MEIGVLVFQISLDYLGLYIKQFENWGRKMFLLITTFNFPDKNEMTEM